MTSVHMYTQPTQSNNGVNGIDNQNKGIIQSPSKYDEAERVRKRMDNLRKHHNESTEIYNRTQPKINDQIHKETLKYLENNQVNGTKAKNQKQRAPKKQRTASNSNNNIININNNSTATTTVVQQNNATITSSANGYSPNHHQTPPLSQPQPPTNHMQPQPQQQITLYPTHMQQQQPQQTMHMQPKLIQNNHQMQAQAQAQTQPQSQQPQQHFNYQPNNGNIYQQSQPTMHNNIQYQPNQPQHPQHIYTPQQHQIQNQTHILGQPVELQNHYVVQPHSNQATQQHFTHQSLNGTHHMSHQQQPNYRSSHTSIAPVHNDLDLTLQAGLECDVDSLIKHEMSVEGQLDFNHELLLKLDNHYPRYN